MYTYATCVHRHLNFQLKYQLVRKFKPEFEHLNLNELSSEISDLTILYTTYISMN